MELLLTLAFVGFLLFAVLLHAWMRDEFPYWMATHATQQDKPNDDKPSSEWPSVSKWPPVE